VAVWRSSWRPRSHARGLLDRLSGSYGLVAFFAGAVAFLPVVFLTLPVTRSRPRHRWLLRPASHPSSPLGRDGPAPHAVGLTGGDGEVKALDTHRTCSTDGDRLGGVAVVVVVGEPAVPLGVTGAQGQPGPVVLGEDFSGY
jgi:hypothetical protein